MDGPHADKSGFVHTCCAEPLGALDLYRARLSEADHYNSKGRPLASAAGVVRQDRANYHKFGLGDIDDTDDQTFHDRKKRGWLSAQLDRIEFDRTETAKKIMDGTPLVEVVVWERDVDVKLVEPQSDLSDLKIDACRPLFEIALVECEIECPACDERNMGDCHRDALASLKECGRKRVKKASSSCTKERNRCRKGNYAGPGGLRASEQDCETAVQRCLMSGIFWPW